MSEKGQPRHQNALSPTEFLRGPGRSFVLDLGLVEQTTFSAGARLVYFVQTPLLCQVHDPTSLGRVATHSPDRWTDIDNATLPNGRSQILGGNSHAHYDPLSCARCQNQRGRRRSPNHLARTTRGKYQATAAPECRAYLGTNLVRPIGQMEWTEDAHTPGDEPGSEQRSRIARHKVGAYGAAS